MIMIPSRVKKGFRIAIYVLSLAFEREAVAGPDPGLELTEDPANPMQVAITIRGRNASAQLADTLVRLSRLKASREFAPQLTFSDDEIGSFDACARHARTDSSGRTFDLARCAGIWPSKDKAPELKSFENAFTKAVGREGIRAFPAVKVSAFDYQEPIKASQLANLPKGTPYEPRDNGTLVLKPAIADQLCNQAITFVDRTQCKVRVVRQVPPQEPLILVSQTGYRIALLRDMPKPTGQKLATAVRDTAAAAPPNSASRLSVGMARKHPGLKIPQGGASSADAAEPIAKRFADHWKGIGVDPRELELDDRGSAKPPVVLVFDTIDDGRASTFADWLGRARGSPKTMDHAKCTLGELRDWHSDAVASEVVPYSLLSSVLPTEPVNADDMPSFTGYVLSSRHFQGISSVMTRDSTAYMWYDEGAFDDKGAAPAVVGIVVYSDKYGGSDEARVDHAAMSILDSPTKLLVVSAGDANGESGYSKQDSVVRSKLGLEENCRGRSWPSCIGPHPRVVVVAPSEPATSAAARARLMEPARYMLGRSTVKVAAYGRGIPVISPCRQAVPPASATAPGGGSSWLVHDGDGSSFAAPAAGLLLARLINVGDALVKDAPEIALWRMLATTDPLSQVAGAPDAREAVAFGQINMRRALAGADELFNSPGRAVVYPRSDEAGHVEARRAVIAPYPWNDAILNVERDGTGLAAKPEGIVRFPRGVLAYTDMRDPKKPRFTAIDFGRVLRLVRRTDAAGSNTFDMYFTEVKPAGYNGSVVSVATIQIGGPSSTDPESQGFCRIDGIARPASGPAQAQPACLYTWDPAVSGSGFRPLDLTTVDDIVLPPLHFRMGRPAPQVDVTKVSSVTAPDSPWRKEFCKVGLRKRLAPILKVSSDKPDFAGCGS